MSRSRPLTGLARRVRVALMMLMAAFMLAAAPALAAGSQAIAPGAVATMQPMQGNTNGCAEAGSHHKAMPAHCLASCLAAMGVTSPAVPFTTAPPPPVRSAPEPVTAGALVPHGLPVDPPPPRIS